MRSALILLLWAGCSPYPRPFVGDVTICTCATPPPAADLASVHVELPDSQTVFLPLPIDSIEAVVLSFETPEGAVIRGLFPEEWSVLTAENAVFMPGELEAWTEVHIDYRVQGYFED